MNLRTNLASKRLAVFTVDVEQDISKYFKGQHKGVVEGLPRILDVLKETGIKGTFFWTGDVAKGHPELFRRCVDEGHEIGCHGMDHSIEYYHRVSQSRQEKDIGEAKRILDSLLGKPVSCFRAPNFGFGPSTLAVIEKLGFTIDSSILPERHVRKWKLFPLVDFRNAPRNPYRLDTRNVRIAGNSRVIEVPATTNPDNPGIPIGMGYLNARGKESFLRVSRAADSNPLVLLSHPWEAVKLDAKDCPGWVSRACRMDIDTLESVLTELKLSKEFVSLDTCVKIFES